MLSNGLVYLCMAEESFSRRNCFMFLAVSRAPYPHYQLLVLTRVLGFFLLVFGAVSIRPGFQFARVAHPFAPLCQDVAGRFESTFGERGLTASSFEMNDEFHRVLQQQMVPSPPSALSAGSPRGP